MAKKPKAASKAASKASKSSSDAPPAKGSVPGDNNPPPDAFETMQAAIDDLYFEAENWLDADPISTEAQAEKVTELKAKLKEAAKTADAERAAEKKPHWDAGKAVDTKWKAIIEKADKAVKAANRKLTPWLQAIEAERQRRVQEAREEAAKLEREAEERRQKEAAGQGDLANTYQREAAEEEAKEAAKKAKSIARGNTTVRGADGAKTYMRTVWKVNVNQAHILLKHYRETDPDWLKTVLRERAEKDVRGGARELPGCNIWDEKEAV